MAECKARQNRDERVLVTTLTKRMSEDLTSYLNQMGVTARYLHSDIDTLERMAIIHDLRAGEFSVLVESTCSGKGWIYRRFPWWPFWMRTRKAFCVQPDLWCRHLAAPQETRRQSVFVC